MEHSIGLVIGHFTVALYVLICAMLTTNNYNSGDLKKHIIMAICSPLIMLICPIFTWILCDNSERFFETGIATILSNFISLGYVHANSKKS